MIHRMTPKNLVSQELWDGSYEALSLAPATFADPIRQWLQGSIPRVTPRTGPKSAFEVGCFPGRYLAVLGERGYELNGIDLTPRIQEDMVPWLASQGFAMGRFERADFFSMTAEKRFDVVASFGFIEHFERWDEVLERHCDLVADGGYLAVSTPNFRGVVQRALHRVLDQPNYERHFVPSMRPDAWAEIASAKGFEVLFAGHFGRFSFWADSPPRHGLHQLSLALMRKATPLLAACLPADQPSYAPFCGLIARRR